MVDLHSRGDRRFAIEERPDDAMRPDPPQGATDGKHQSKVALASDRFRTSREVGSRASSAIRSMAPDPSVVVNAQRAIFDKRQGVAQRFVFINHV